HTAGPDRARGEAPALAAKADSLLDVLDRRGERKRIVSRRREEVEGEPLRRTGTDAGETRELRDKVLHGRAQHAVSVAGEIGQAGLTDKGSRGSERPSLPASRAHPRSRCGRESSPPSSARSGAESEHPDPTAASA